jgi:hypothetical protein
MTGTLSQVTPVGFLSGFYCASLYANTDIVVKNEQLRVFDEVKVFALPQ